MKEREDPRQTTLAALAREEAEGALADPRWEELAAGTISAEDRAALDALAARSPEAEGAPALFAPLGAAAEARFAEAISAQLAADRSTSATVATAAKELPATVATAAKEQPPAPVRAPAAQPARARWSGRWIAVGSGLAMAATFALGLALRTPDDALPTFETVFVNGVKERRSTDDAEPVRVRPGSVITAAVRPATPVKGPIAARAWLLRGASVIGLATTFESSEDGAIRLAARFGSAQAIEAGPAELVIAVCRPAALPADLRELKSACRSLRRAVVVELE